MSSFKKETPSSSSSNESRKKAEEWQSKIKETQLSRATPEMIATMRATAERQRLAGMARQQTESLSRVNYVQLSSNARTLTDFSSIRSKAKTKSASPVDVSGEYSTVREGSAARTMTLDKALRRVSTPSPSPALLIGGGGVNGLSSSSSSLAPPPAPLKSLKAKKVFTPAGFGGGSSSLTPSVRHEDDSEDEEIDEGELELRQVEAELGIHYTAATSSAVHAETNRVALIVSSNLRELETEPTDPAETSAKFTLFENASQTVTTIREQTLKFWAENQASFPGKSGEECLRDITKIDSQDAMGIQDDPRVWFIFSMIKKCNENSTAINDLLSRFRSRLELLLQEPGDCPFCLEVMTQETACALGCCHRVCSDCWDNWVELKGANAFCPLCRHTEFIDELSTPP